MTNPLLLRRLYRSLLQSSKPFSSPSRDAAVLSCLLHRTGVYDAFDDRNAQIAAARKKEKNKDDKPLPKALVRDLTKSYAEIKEEFESQDDLWPTAYSNDESHAPDRVLFRRLLREVISGSPFGTLQMQHPSKVDTTRLQKIIRREFRGDEGAISTAHDDSTRQQVAFSALRALNTKLAWAETMDTDDEEEEEEDDESTRQIRNQRQEAKGVSPLPVSPPSAYLQPGCYLVAHPLLTGFFHRTVICLLEHTDLGGNGGGTYGLIINRVGVSPTTGRDCTLRDVIRSDSLPKQLQKAFGNCTIREGGPVHMSLQMMHACSPEQEELVGGTVLSTLEDPHEQQQQQQSQPTSTALDSDRAIYFQGSISRAAQAVVDGELDRDDVSFYVGASCWEVGQLESEMERGYWLPCRGPPDIALTGMCGHNNPSDEEAAGKVERPKADLWLSMMCALGQEEANLAHFMWNADLDDEHGGACDVF